MAEMKQAILEKWREYRRMREEGMAVELAAARANLSPSSAYRYERGEPGTQGIRAAMHDNTVLPDTVDIEQPQDNNGHTIPQVALDCLDDFQTFRLRYFGRKSAPWQVQAAERVAGLVATRDKEYVVMNEPPGSGKSTLFTHDIVCWMIARNRNIRIQIGSRTERQARMYVGRVKRSLERAAPMLAASEDKDRGLAWDAVATLAEDYGNFRPGSGELWRAEALVVHSPDKASDDKEPTVSAWGMDSGFLGGRFDLIIWDDLVDAKNTRSVEARDTLAELYFTEMETRLEPGGLLLLQGQRIAPDDLYRTALDQTGWNDKPKYSHVVYQAHDDTRCKGIHSRNAVAWPKGCLLDPYRLPWRQLETVRRNNPRVFALMYQQVDGTGVGGLVETAWIEGGTDSNNEEAPGCLDRERPNKMMPATQNPLWSYITVDPSPTEWWGVLRWLYDDTTGTWHIMDIRRLRMRPDDWLAYDLGNRTFSGELVKMMADAEADGTPVTDVIVEINAAQRWLLSQPHVQLYMKQTGVRFIQHTTARNKLDPQYGVETLSGKFKEGRIRIPWGSASARIEYKPLVDELLRYPDGTTTDLVMATWFSVLAVNNHFPGNRRGAVKKQGRALYSDVRRGIA